MKAINMLNDFKEEEARIKGWKPRKTCSPCKVQSKKKADREEKTSTGRDTPPRSKGTRPRHNPQYQEDLDRSGDWEELEESPRSKTLTALNALLQDENANETTSQLVENLRSHLGADIDH